MVHWRLLSPQASAVQPKPDLSQFRPSPTSKSLNQGFCSLVLFRDDVHDLPHPDSRPVNSLSHLFNSNSVFLLVLLSRSCLSRPPFDGLSGGRPHHRVKHQKPSHLRRVGEPSHPASAISISISNFRTNPPLRATCFPSSDYTSSVTPILLEA